MAKWVYRESRRPTLGLVTGQGQTGFDFLEKLFTGAGPYNWFNQLASVGLPGLDQLIGPLTREERACIALLEANATKSSLKLIVMHSRGALLGRRSARQLSQAATTAAASALWLTIGAGQAFPPALEQQIQLLGTADKLGMLNTPPALYGQMHWVKGAGHSLNRRRKDSIAPAVAGVIRQHFGRH